MTDHFKDIYAGSESASRYDALVSREDYRHNLLPALNGIRPLAGLEVVEFGAGTGRLTLLLASQVKNIRAFDNAPAMLKVLGKRMVENNITNCTASSGDNRALPLPGATADLAVEGWSFGHLVGWYPDSWQVETGQALAEMERILRPGGTAILLETLGTGAETPRPPTPGLAAFYNWLQTEHGFNHTWLRTDYRFESLAEAEELTRFFFGEELAQEVRRQNQIIVPECTGLWWRTGPF
jgi:ubiquinone/menaquinone biosynthesis C-methylase UbiE